MNIAEYYRNNPKLFWMIIGVAAVVIVALCVAIALAIQNHNDRVPAVEITESESDLRLVGAQISEIKDHDFKSMEEYTKAYARIEPLTAFMIKSSSGTAIFTASLNREIRTVA
jgi:hypothetical protein